MQSDRCRATLVTHTDIDTAGCIQAGSTGRPWCSRSLIWIIEPPSWWSPEGSARWFGEPCSSVERVSPLISARTLGVAQRVARRPGEVRQTNRGHQCQAAAAPKLASRQVGIGIVVLSRLTTRRWSPSTAQRARAPSRQVTARRSTVTARLGGRPRGHSRRLCGGRSSDAPRWGPHCSSCRLCCRRHRRTGTA